jgi:hypothetical protein
MDHRKPMALALALTAGVPCTSFAQEATDLNQIRQEIEAVKQDYEKRIQDLENRLKQAEEAAKQAQTSAKRAEEQAQSAATQAKQSAEAAAQAPAPSQPAAASAFNPALSLILQGGYYNSNQDPNTRTITGFLGPGELGLPERGFNLGESEITLSANVDQLFYGQATFSIEDGAINAEEAYFQTLALGHGFTIKGGRYFSGIGYENSRHKHAWDFEDDALVQQAFLGENFAIDGLQANWIAPLASLYVELGAEGGKPVEFPFSASPGSDDNHNGFQVATVFAHLGGDIGVSHSYRFGVWAMNADNNVTDQPIPALGFTGVQNTLTGGNDKVWGLDFVYKWAPDGNQTYRNFKLVAEWMQRKLDGTLTYAAGDPAAQTGDFTAKQSGWFVQGVYQFHPEWRAGLRYGQLQEGSYDLGAGLIGAPTLTPPNFTPKRASAMVDWSPSEFSRFRLQYNQDKSEMGITDNQWFLQYILSLGTHGAHQF